MKREKSGRGPSQNNFVASGWTSYLSTTTLGKNEPEQMLRNDDSQGTFRSHDGSVDVSEENAVKGPRRHKARCTFFITCGHIMIKC